MWQARHALSGNRQHDGPFSEQHSLIVHRFLDAYEHGDMASLLSVLTDDVTLYTDGGGKVKAARKPLYGAFKAARFLLAVKHKVPELLVSRFARINGQSGIIRYQQEAPFSVMVFDIAEQKIREVNVIVNPDKLRHILPPCQGTRR